MQQQLLEMEQFAVQLQLWPNPLAANLERDGLGVLFDAADNVILKYATACGIRPDSQHLGNQKMPLGVSLSNSTTSKDTAPPSADTCCSLGLSVMVGGSKR